MLLLAHGASAQTPSNGATADNRAAVGRRAVRALTAALADDDAEVRAAAAAAFGDIGNGAAAKVLKRALADKNPAVRVEAGFALHRLGDESGLAAIEAVVTKGVKMEGTLSPAEQLRLVARDESRILGIRRLADIGGEEVVNLFEKTLKDPSGAVRDATAIALARLGLDEFEPQFLTAAKDPDEAVRVAAVRALGEIGQPSGLDPLEAASRDSSVAVREEAMRAFARFPSEESARMLARGVKDPDARVRSQALAGLAKLNDTESSPLLRETLKANQALEAQLKCQAGLARRGDRVDLRTADDGLAQKDFDLRLLAVELLSVVDTSASTAMLVRAAESDPDGRVRVRAAAALVRRLARGGAR